MKPKILYVITQGHWGGAQKYVYDLATNVTSDFDVTVAVGEPNGKRDLQLQIADLGLQIKIIQLNHLQRAISPAEDLLAISELRKLFKGQKPYIIHLNSSKAGILGSIASINLKSKILNPKSIYTAHGWVFDEPISKFRVGLYKFLERTTANKKDHIITVSQADAKTAVQKLKIAKTKISTIYPGVEPSSHDLANKPKRPFTFVTVANHYKTKALDNLIKAFQIAHQDMPGSKLAMIGDGPERDKLESLSKKLSIYDHIDFRGFLENAAAGLNPKNYDVFVLTSRKEGMPYTIIEAKDRGLPIVATKVGGVPEVIEHKKTGLLVDPDNIEQLSDALQYAYKNKDEMKKMAEKGHLENKFMLKNMIEETTLLYQRLLQ